MDVDVKTMSMGDERFPLENPGEAFALPQYDPTSLQHNTLAAGEAHGTVSQDVINAVHFFNETVHRMVFGEATENPSYVPSTPIKFDAAGMLSNISQRIIDNQPIRLQGQRHHNSPISGVVGASPYSVGNLGRHREFSRVPRITGITSLPETGITELTDDKSTNSPTDQEQS